MTLYSDFGGGPGGSRTPTAFAAVLQTVELSHMLSADPDQARGPVLGYQGLSAPRRTGPRAPGYYRWCCILRLSSPGPVGACRFGPTSGAPWMLLKGTVRAK